MAGLASFAAPGSIGVGASRGFPDRRSRDRAHAGSRSRRVVRVDAGIKYKREDVEVDRQIGEGSFGIVYQGRIDARKTGDVVLKRPKLTVEGAAELQEVEAWMNDRVSRDARGSCADYLGSFRVSPDESYLNQSQGVSAKEGLWLVWKFEGDRTLAQYMAQPDYPTGIARHLLRDKDGDKSLRGDPAVELEVTQAAMKQLFTNLKNVHKAGLVHRDIKPHNLVLTGTDDEARFKLIDLGACACFRTGMNFAPDETIMDPKYAPPEEFLIPSDDAPDIRKLFGPVALAAGSAAWLQHKPDRFDMYSAGIVMMQLALPSLRTNSGLVTFNKGLKRCGYDLFLWRDANKGQLTASKTVVLDAGDGAGWELARALLRPRAYDEDAEVNAAVARNKARKSNDDDAQTEMMSKGERPSAEEALRHRFFSVDPAEVAAMVARNQIVPRGRKGGAFEIFENIFGGGDRRKKREEDAEAEEGEAEAEEVFEEPNLLSNMLGLEKRISRQQELISQQSTTIMRMRSEGAPAEEIEAEQRTLEKMKVGLQGLLRSFSFSQVEAKTTMVKAATELQIEAEKAGVEPPPMEGFMRSIFGKRAASAAVDAADSVLDSILDVLKPDRGAAAEPGNAAGEALTESSLAALTDEVEETTLDASEEEDMEAEAEVEIDPRRDPDELRRRMDDIKSEMVAVAEQMAEMERRLLLQQADLEARQAQLESDAGRAVEEDFISEEADRKGRVLTNAAGEMIGSKDVANIADIEETKREIEEALSRIDRMQETQKDLTEEGPR